MFTLCDFGGNVAQGHYSFPFSFLLPNAISGSFYYSDESYIRYKLRALMNHPLKKEDNQYYDIFVNIIEPPRIPLGPALTQTTKNAKCCGCCMDYGLVTINMKCDRNFGTNSDLIKIEGVIDNSRGRIPIDSGKVTFEERRVLISDDDAV